MYEHIIVPFDGTKAANRAVLLAADVSTLADAHLVVATSSAARRRSSIRTVKDRAISFSDDRVTVWLEPAPSLRAAFETMVAYRPQSLICMYTHARTGLLRSVYGNLAQTLLRVVDAPLLLIGPAWTESSVAHLNHLIVCVDGSPASEAAISLAADWADMLPLDVTVLHVRTSDDVGPVDLDRLAAPLESRCEIVDKVVVNNADVVEGVLDVVRHSIEPFVVMATHARTGVDRLRHGSIVAELSAKCPVPILVQRGDNPEPAAEPGPEPAAELGTDRGPAQEPEAAVEVAGGGAGAPGEAAAGAPAALGHGASTGSLDDEDRVAIAAAAAREAAQAAAAAAESAAAAAAAAATAAAAADAAAVVAAAAASGGALGEADEDDVEVGEAAELVATVVDVADVANLADLVGVPKFEDVDEQLERDRFVPVVQADAEPDVEPDVEPDAEPDVEPDVEPDGEPEGPPQPQG